MKPGRGGQALFLSFSAAIFVAVYLLHVRLWPWLGLAFLAPAGLLFWRRRRLAVLVCLGIAAALLWCGAYRAVFFAPAQELDGRQTRVTLCLSEFPTATDYGASATGWVIRAGKAPVQAVLYGDIDLLDLRPGDRVTVRANCSQTALRPDSRFTAGATRGVFLRLVAKGSMEVDRADAVPWWCLPRFWGEKLGQSVEHAVDSDVAGLLKALATGDRSGIDSAVNTQLKRSGIAHLVAVSGMHVCFLVSFLTRLTGSDPRRRAVVCIPALLFFALAVGGAASVLRACCLQMAVLVADLLGRETERWTSLSGTLALLLLLDPFSAANVGLQLSFAAIAGIGVVSERAYAALTCRSLPGESRWARWNNAALRFLASLLATTLGALVFTVPLSAWYFGTVCLAAPVTNLLVLPVAGALFAGTLAAGLVGLVFPTLAGLLGLGLTWLARYVLGVAGTVAAFPYSSLPLRGVYYPAAFGALYALVLIAIFWKGQRRRIWLFLFCAGTLVAGSVALTWLDFRLTTLTAAVLDVGQGQSVVLMSGGKTAVIDCGGTGYDDPGDLCADYLQARGESRVDTLILTHYHADHVSGLSALFRRLEVRELILPAMGHDQDVQLEILALAAEEGAEVTWLAADGLWTLGKVELRLYAPMGTGGANEEGLSALVTAGDFDLLVTGDMNTVVEERLVRKGLPRCQVLVAGHHGSATSTGESLLHAVDPSAALISVGENNPYGHPDPEALERLAANGAAIYRTDRMGTLTVRVR